MASVASAAASAADDVRHRVARSVALSIALTKDFTPRARPPPVADMVAMELPRVLACTARDPVVRSRLGGLVVSLDMPWTENPERLLDTYMDALGDDPAALVRAGNHVLEHGHEDFVFGVLKYTRKPPSNTDATLVELYDHVANVLGIVPRPEHADKLRLAYEATHAELLLV